MSSPRFGLALLAVLLAGLGAELGPAVAHPSHPHSSAAAVAGVEPARSAAVRTEAAVTEADLRAHLGVLASDEFEGRRAGTRGEALAAAYLADALESAGVEPAGDDGTYFQDTGARRWLPELPPVLRAHSADGSWREFGEGVDFSFRAGKLPEGELPLTFVNAATDPLPTPSADRAVYLELSSRETREALEAWGEAQWGLVLTRGSSRVGQLPGRPRSGLVLDVSGPVSLRVRGDLRAVLEAGEFTGVELMAGGVFDTHPCVNVLGRIPARAGSPLADEVVLLSAHFDHLGVRQAPQLEGPDVPAGTTGTEGEGSSDTEPAEVDLVFNGADDDASGVVAVLEIVEALAAEAPPERTVLVLLATAEEEGLVGTKYFIEHPPAPLASMVVNLNYEMIGRPDPAAGGPGKLWLTGYERSTLGEELTARDLGVVPDPYPDQNFFQRSDNYALALRGVVAQTLSSYALHAEYHTVDDELETLDFEHLTLATRFALEATRAVASGALTPVWREGGSPEPKTR